MSRVTGLPDLPPGPVEGTVMVETVSIQWDPRCVPVTYQLNTAVLPANAEPPLDRLLKVWPGGALLISPC